MRLVHVLLVALLLAAPGCSSTQREALSESNVTVEQLSFQSVLPELAAKGISGTARKIVDPRLAESIWISDDENRYHLDIQFGTLSPSDFETIRAFFGGHTKVPYQRDRAYDITDFLHPAMQAVVNQTFQTRSFSGQALWEDPRAESFGGEEQFESLAKNGIEINANCYNTTSELVRQIYEGRTAFNLYIPSREDANTWFSSDEYSEEVDDKALRFGDVLAVKQRQESMGNTPYVMHTTMALSQHLVFEKTNASEDDAYRIALRSDVLALYKRTFGNDLVLSYRRFGATRKPLPTLKAPANEVETKYVELLKATHPDLKPENITLTTDFAFGSGGWSVAATEIQPTEVILNPRTQRGILKAKSSVLARFVALKNP